MCGHDLAREEKEVVILDSAAPKSDFLFFVENYYSDPQYEIGDRTVKNEKLKLADEFLHSLLEWNFLRNKNKIKGKSTTQILVKQLKENSTENSAEKSFKEGSQLNELWNISTKQKMKR